MPFAEIAEDRISVQTVWSEKEMIKQVPGASWDSDAKMWHVPKSWSACVQLRGVFECDLTIGPELRKWAAAEKASRIQPSLDLRGRTDVDEPSDLAFNSKLFSFQKAGVRFLLTAGSALLADEMGTGKTVQTLEFLRLSQGLPALVVCPKSMMGTWKREAGFWFPDAVAYRVQGSIAERRKTLEDASLDPNAIVIINFEGVRGHSRLSGYGSEALRRCAACGGSVLVKAHLCEMHKKELNSMSFKTVVVDEAHRMKDPKAKQTRAIWALGAGKGVQHRLALTGTPLANHPGDLWSIMHFVAPVDYPRKSAFVGRYCRVDFNAWGGMEIRGVNADTKDELYRIIDPRFRRMPKALVLPQLPAKMPVKRYIQMTDKQAEAYKKLEAGSMIVRLDNGDLLVAKGDLAAQNRLLQFSSAYMQGSHDEGFTMCEPSPKLDAMMDIIDEMGDKQVVFCAQSRQLIELAEKRLIAADISYAIITGKIPQWQRDLYLQDFQSGKRQAMLFTIQAGGVGLTMTAADTIVFLQRSWSMVENKQAEDRVHRIGSEIHDSVKVIDLITEGTIEEKQIERLWEKSKRLDEITRDTKVLEAAGLSTAHLEAEAQSILNSNLGEP